MRQVGNLVVVLISLRSGHLRLAHAVELVAKAGHRAFERRKPTRRIIDHERHDL